jgi:hypothetical protein
MEATSEQVHVDIAPRVGGWKALLAGAILTVSVLSGVLIGRATADMTPATGAPESLTSFESGPQRTMADRIHPQHAR